jgi:C-terminal processing protease CtpA/Prc
VISSKDTSCVHGGLKGNFTKSSNGFIGKLYSSTYRPRFVTGNLYKEGTLIAMDGGVYWGKVESSFVREVNMINKEDVLLPTVTKLDDKNTLFSIPSFNVEGKQFDKILGDNYDLLIGTTNLIFDVRGNTGGNALYLSFLDAYATKNLDSSQGLILASQDTKLYYEAQAKYSKDIFQPVVDRINRSLGQIVDGPLYPTKNIQPLKTKIQKVAILTDRGCMSAAESFILHSKNVSNKVITFGSRTAGVIDYTSVNTIKLNSSGIQTIYFGYPTSSWHKQIPDNGYNRTGIIPDVPIDESVKDKVKFIVDYLSH